MGIKNAKVVNGYKIVYDPKNPRAMTNSNWKGWVYEHIKIAGIFLKRPLRKDEVVHHLDGDRSNNRTDNLLVLLRSQHVKLHNWLNGAVAKKFANVNRVNSKNTESCVICGATLQAKQKLCCSNACNAKRKLSNSNKPSKAQLKLDLKSSQSMLALGRKYNVSDNAVRKWIASYKLTA